MYDGNVEVLQNSVDGVRNGFGVVGLLNTFDLFHKFFDLLNYGVVVSDRDPELLDIGFFMIRKFRSVGVGCLTPMIPASVEPWIFSSSYFLTDLPD